MCQPYAPAAFTFPQDRPLGFQEVEAHRSIDNRHMKVVRLSALRTGRLYLPPQDRPLGFQEVEAHRFIDNRHMKVVMCQPYAPAAFTPQEILLVLISVTG
jgi:hypothetical protein